MLIEVVWYLLVAAGSILIFSFLFNRETTLSYSIGYNLYASERLLKGEIPYRDFHTLYPPATLYLNSAIFKLFGISLYNALAGVFVFKALTSVVLFRCARYVLNRYLSLAVVIGSWIWLRPNGPFKAVPMHYGALFLAAAIALLLADRGKGDRVRIFAAGVALGVLTLFKHNIGIYTLIGTMLVLAPADGVLKLKLSRLAENWRRVAVLLMGYLVTLLPAGAYQLINGAFVPMIRSLFFGPGEFLVSRLASAPSPVVPLIICVIIVVMWIVLVRFGLSRRFGPIAVAAVTVFLLTGPQKTIDPLIFYGPAFVIAVGLFFCTRIEGWRELLILIVGAGAALLEAFPRFAREQAIAAMPFVILLSFYLSVRLIGHASEQRKRETSLIHAFAIVPVLLLLPGLRLFHETFFERGLTFRSDAKVSVTRAAGVFFPQSKAQEIENVVAFIQDRVHADGYVFAQSYAGSSFLFLAERNNPSGAQFWGGVGVSDKQRAETLDAIDRLRVSVVVTGEKDIAAESYQPMRDYLQANFRRATQFGETLLLERSQ